MPVDPEIKAILDEIAPFLPSTFDDVEPAQFRALSDAHSMENARKTDIEKVEDLEIPSGSLTLKARLYSDNDQSDSMIVFYHGGGFVIGNIETHDSVCRVLSKYSGSKVMSVDYRLAPENKFPSAVDDAFNSFSWIMQNSSRFGVRKEKIAVSGDSAGGNLSIAVSIRMKEKGLNPPKLQALFYPVVAPDVASESFREFSEGLFLTSSIMNWFHKHYIQTEKDFLSPYFSPLLTGNLEGLPETIIVTAEYDPLRDQGETFLSKIRNMGTKAEGIRALGMIHGFLTFHGQSQVADNILKMVARHIGDRLNER